MTDTLVELFVDSVRRHAERVVVSHPGPPVTYSALHYCAAAFAHDLARLGVTPGDRVGVRAHPGGEYLLAYVGVILAGGCVVGIDPLADAVEEARILEHSGARVVVRSRPRPGRSATKPGRPPESPPTVFVPEHPFVARSAPDPTATPVGVQPDALAQIIYTSGTTGRPKGVALTHRALAANTRSILQYLRLGPDDRALLTMPPTYSYGNSVVLTHLAAGGSLVFSPGVTFWNSVVDLMESQAVTGFPGVPTSILMLLHRSKFLKQSLPRLRYVTSAGGALPQADIGVLRKSRPELELYVMYGQTEACARLAALLPHEVDQHPGSVGRPIPGVEIVIRDEHAQPVDSGQIGELTARGPNLMAGYWRDPDATQLVLRDGWLYTGDLARKDREGYVYIEGRRSDFLKVGGTRVAPQEIEEVLTATGLVGEAAVVGRPDRFLGEQPFAFVVPAPGAPSNWLELLHAACDERLARHKRVAGFQALERLPRTSSGKVKRQQLRESLESGSTAVPRPDAGKAS